MPQRNYLREAELASLFDASAKTKRTGDRNAFMLEFAYSHGLRSKELVSLRWDQLDLAKRIFRVERAKNGKTVEHTLTPREVQYFIELQNDSSYVFLSERGRPLSTRAIRKIVTEAGSAAGIQVQVHSHMLRHSCGYAMANLDETPDIRLIQDYLGHKNIQHTVRYTEVNSARFARMQTSITVRR